MVAHDAHRKVKGKWPVIACSQGPTHFLQLGSTSRALQTHEKQCTTRDQSFKTCVKCSHEPVGDISNPNCSHHPLLEPLSLTSSQLSHRAAPSLAVTDTMALFL